MGKIAFICEPIPNTSELSTTRFDDLALAAVLIYSGHQIDVEPPEQQEGWVTFCCPRTPETDQLTRDYATSSLRLDPRRFYDALGIAKRLVHRARERVR